MRYDGFIKRCPGPLDIKIIDSDDYCCSRDFAVRNKYYAKADCTPSYN